MKVEDTSKRPRDEHMLGMMASGDKYITRMEARGQILLVNSDRIPAQGPLDELTRLGFAVDAPDPDDPLFRPCTLPPGWTKDYGDHDMHSYIVDQRGVRMVHMFYKAAFYDRRASFQICDPGYSMAQDIALGNEVPDPVLPALYGVLTAEEREKFWLGVDTYAAMFNEYPTIYADKKPIIDALLAAKESA